MAAATQTTHDGLSELARSARAQWRKACFRGEAQRTGELFEKCRDTFAFAGAYVSASRRREVTLANVRRDIEAENYGFFTAQGVSPGVLDRSLAQRLLRDWDNSVVSYLTRLEERFEVRFNEDLGAFCAMPSNAIAVMLSLQPEVPPQAHSVERGAGLVPPTAARVDVCA
jgi:hypothetical protein